MKTLYRRLLAAGPMRESVSAPFLLADFCSGFSTLALMSRLYQCGEESQSSRKGEKDR